MLSTGAHPHGATCTFTVWAPTRASVDVHILSGFERTIPMIRDDRGYWRATVENAPHGTLYRYRLDGNVERADPVSYCQPQGVHGPSMVFDHRLHPAVTTAPAGVTIDKYVIYELHAGAFTAEGTFDAAARLVPQLQSLGITAVEIMPVAHFPGKRNWGYDGVYPYAVHTAYGGISGLGRFIDTCHNAGIAVILDVVYNHLGPEGNYLRDFGPYFTDRYRTPWGESINYDGEYSDDVAAFFIANACYWLRSFTVDALRLDAVHAICDFGARPFLQRLSETVEREFGTVPAPRYLFAESDLNDRRVILDRQHTGLGMDAQWSDDFHHALHSLLTGERRGYYTDFGDIDHLAAALQRSFVYDGRYSAFRSRSHGNDVSTVDTGRFVVCSQNHDQIGNRMRGERLITLTDFPRAQCAAAAVMLSPYIPLLFMGEEHAETAPFLYFADHGDDSLIDAVREGRKREFAGFFDGEEPPDPFDIATFRASSVDWSRRDTLEGATMLRLYGDCLRLRRDSGIIGTGPRDRIAVHHRPDTRTLVIEYRLTRTACCCMFNFDEFDGDILLPLATSWRRVLDSTDYLLPPGVSRLPDALDRETTTLTLRPYSFAVYAETTTDTSS